MELELARAKELDDGRELSIGEFPRPLETAEAERHEARRGGIGGRRKEAGRRTAEGETNALHDELFNCVDVERANELSSNERRGKKYRRC